MDITIDPEDLMRLYPFPKPQRHLKPPRGYDPLIDGPLPRKYWDFSTHVIRWMGRNGLRRLTEYYRATQPFPSAETLSEWMFSIAEDAGVLNHFSYDKVQRMTEAAAAFALESWDEEQYLARVRRARNGGRKSRRGPTYTLEMLQALSDDLSIAQQARALGCSEGTISTLRRQQKAATRDAKRAAVLEELRSLPGLLPETDARRQEPEIPPTDPFENFLENLLDGSEVGPWAESASKRPADVSLRILASAVSHDV